jgi:hypothetical protein
VGNELAMKMMLSFLEKRFYINLIVATCDRSMLKEENNNNNNEYILYIIYYII